MRFRVLLPAFAFGLSAIGAPAAMANAHGPVVPIFRAAYGTPKVDVLAGDTVTWHNDSFQPHTVSAVDASFASARLLNGGSYSHRFATPGVVGYFCAVHPYMRAEVDVHRVMLDAPHDAAAPGRPYELTGRAALPAGTAVSIQAGDGSQAATATVDAHGSFQAIVTPRATTAYRAVAGAEASPLVQVLVLDRKVTAAARSRHGRAAVRTRVVPGAPGATVVLQLHLEERFGWWPVKRAKLDKRSRARFSVRLSHKVRARVVLVGSDGATPLARSAVLRLKPR
jgi:plastocyanin